MLAAFKSMISGMILSIIGVKQHKLFFTFLVTITEGKNEGPSKITRVEVVSRV